ncbi:unnamed protein product [Medioppia subpectinata]|uniref:Carboxylesterase type B domain-containing protein n=1 Tax=Medioppia subpectinata TaxID=1979941 RepID=A0A7R9LB87_9ACAR|nr:unnamed protein product [Medioppia subpectinata]CAG2117446.1 unnamed protein product [Medioppia subpectinata]
MILVKDMVKTKLPIDVKTTSGVVRGLTLQVLNKTVDQYLNIPFAEPPVGDLRFAPPVPLKQPLKLNIKIMI